MQISEKKWGPIVWSIIHIISSKYINYDQMSIFITIYRNFIVNIIPCQKCFEEYRAFIKDLLFIPNKLEYSMYIFHNNVRRKLGSSEMSYTNYDKIRYNKQNNNDINNLLNELKDYYISVNVGSKYIEAIDEFLNFLDKNKNIIFHFKPYGNGYYMGQIDGMYDWSL